MMMGDDSEKSWMKQGRAWCALFEGFGVSWFHSSG
jgi:hypothetical protein